MELSEGKHTAEMLVSQSAGSRSREPVTVLSGESLKVGQVIGLVNIGVGRANIPTVVGTGNGTMSALFAGPDVELGTYIVKVITAVANGGVFSITTPSGKRLPDLTLTVGAGATTAYRSRHVNFSITDGSTDFAANDQFSIVVEAGDPAVVGTGNGTLTLITLGPNAKPGRYRAICRAAGTNTGTFEIIGPDGDSIGHGVIAGGAGGTFVFSGRQLNATVTDGSTDFAVGDFFEVFAFNRSPKAAKWASVPVTFDGRQHAVGVMLDEVDATAGDKPGVMLARDAEVNKAELTWHTGATDGEKADAMKDLARVGIIGR